MKKNLVKSMIVMMIGAFMLSSCAKIPQQEIDDANLAIAQAETAGAAMYMPQAFSELKDSMLLAMENIETQNSKMFKNFNVAKEKLLGVTFLASEVNTKTLAKIEELKKQIEVTLQDATLVNEENKALVQKAPKGKGGTTVLMTINAEIANIDEAINAAVNASEPNIDLNKSLIKVTAIKTQASSINMELKAVIEKYQTRK